MPSLVTFLLLLLLSPSGSQVSLSAQEVPVRIETSYDSAKDRTTVRLAPIKIAGGPGKYHSIFMSPFFSFPGHTPARPSIVDFELQTIVRAKLLSTDLYVVFVIDGETVFLSSNRWAVKRPIPGRVWVGEHLVFRMPYETFVKITKAKTFAVKFDGVSFPVGETERQALKELLRHMDSPTS